MVHSLLNEARQEASATVATLEAQLRAYDDLGPEMAAAAAEYGRVQADARRAGDMLRKFNELQHELEPCS